MIWSLLTSLSIAHLMAVGFAFAVAFGLVFLVFGSLYVGARIYRRLLEAPQPLWWRVVRGGATVTVVTFLVYVGTIVVTNGAPNYFVAAGVAVVCYGEAFAVANRRRLTLTSLRIRWLAFALMASLYTVGGAWGGGLIGILGAVLSLILATFYWWLLVKVR